MNFLLSRAANLARNINTMPRIATTVRGCKSGTPPEDVMIDPPDNYIELPRRVHLGDENLDQRKARLLYQSRKRGMLENDLLLSTFADKYLKGMTLEQVEQYDQLINQPSNDWEIYYWGTNVKPVPPEYDNEIMKLFKEHVSNIHKEPCLQMPDLKVDYKN